MSTIRLDSHHAMEAGEFEVNKIDQDLIPDELKDDVMSMSQDSDEKPENRRSKTYDSAAKALLNNDIDLKDMMLHNALKFANRKTKEFQEQFQKGSQKLSDSQLLEQLEQDSQLKKGDHVRLSHAATAKKQISKKMTPEASLIQDEATELPSENERLNQSRQKENAQKSKSATLARQNHRDNVTKSRVAQRPVAEQYLSSLVSHTFNPNEKSKKQVRQLQASLKQMGLPGSDIAQMQKNVQQMVAADMKTHLKKSFVQIATSYDSYITNAKMLAHCQEFSQLIDLSDKMGIFSGAKDTIKDLKQDASRELGQFITAELDRHLVATKLKTNAPHELVKVFDSFNHLAGFVSFDAGEYMASFQKKMDDLGLNYFKHHQEGILDTQLSDQQSDQQQQQSNDQCHQDYLAYFMSSDWKDRLFKRFSLLKQELRYAAEGRSAQIQAMKLQAKRIAKLKLIVKLRDVFERRATLEQFKGPDYQLIRKELKQTLKQLKIIGCFMSKSDIIAIRDQSNRAMFSLIKDAYLKLEVQMNLQPKNNAIRVQCKKYLAILERIKTETTVIEDIKPTMFQHVDFLSDLEVNTAA